MISIDEKYSLFIDTLNLILLPNNKEETLYNTTIINQLQELEGDYYSFLHKKNIDELVKHQYLNKIDAEVIAQIRFNISQIDRALWNPDDFIKSNKWNKVRNKVINLIKTLQFK